MPTLMKKKPAVKTHEFTFVLASVPNEGSIDTFYGICQDGTVAVRGDTARIYFHREGKSLEAALRSALVDAHAADLAVAKVEMAPENV